MARGKLSCRSGPFRGLEIAVGEEAVIGSGEASTVRIASAAVAETHARIRYDGERGSYFLEDLGSPRGTVLDGVPVTHEERLDRLHVITVGGEVDLIFQPLPAERAETAREQEPRREGTRVDREVPTLPLALRGGEPPDPVEAMEAAEGTRIEKLPVGLPEALSRLAGEAEAEGETPARRLALEVRVEGGEVRRLALRPGKNLVGRARRAEARIDSPDLSRRHAAIQVAEGGVRVRDLGSRNHTWVEGRRLEAGVDVEVAVGARLRFAAVEARLVEDRREERADEEPRE